MAQSRKRGRFSKKLRRQRSSNKRFNRGKGIKAFIPSPIPPSPIPPPQAPSPLMPLPFLPIPPPPNPLVSRPTRKKKRWPKFVSFVENLKK
jgi:hypothetical protein